MQPFSLIELTITNGLVIPASKPIIVIIGGHCILAQQEQPEDIVSTGNLFAAGKCNLFRELIAHL
jgi:hypothetical protein